MLRTRPWVLAGGLALFLANTIHGQEGRPALPAETAEDARVKRVLNESLPHDLPKWTIESESRLDGVGSFHDPTEAVTTPFHHEITISYAYHPTEQERAALQADATTTAGIRRVMASTQCEVRAAANDFDDQMHDEAPIRVISRPPFSLALVGDVETRVYLAPGRRALRSEMATPWNIAPWPHATALHRVRRSRPCRSVSPAPLRLPS